MTRVLRFFGKRQDIDCGLLKRGLIDFCEVEEERNLDNKIFVSDSVSDDAYFALCDDLEEGLYAERDIPLSAVLVDFLTENNLMMATAESCTGGMVASRIIDIPGASKIFHEGIVSYSNRAKVDRLSVDAKAIARYGAVSKEVAKEMAYGLLGEYVDVAVSTTGIAGPNGETVGNEYKPAGLVYIGIAFRSCEPIAIECRFSGDRNNVRESATNAALFYTYRLLQQNL